MDYNFWWEMMELIKIAICDDDTMLATQMEEILQNYVKKHGISVQIDLFYQGETLLQYIETQICDYDLIFLDIEMGKLDGIETAARIRNKNKEVLLIFVTSHTHYAIDAYSVRPFQFLVKPFDREKVCSYFQEAYDWISEGEFYFEYLYRKEYHRIFVKDILYFESDKRQIHIYLKDGTKKQYYDKINVLQKKLQKTKADFWRIHQSVLVNSKYIVRKAFDHVELCNGTVLCISENRRKELNMQYIKKMTE